MFKFGPFNFSEIPYFGEKFGKISLLGTCTGILRAGVSFAIRIRFKTL